jgi:hypothetical protein
MPIERFQDPNTLVLSLPYIGQTGPFDPVKSYVIRRPLPNLSVLIVRHERVVQAVLSSGDGSIKFITASEPDAFNTLGSRHWVWSTKGLGKSNEIQGNHGLAITLKIPTDHYVLDKPYAEGTIWSGGGWNPGPDGVLAPLNVVEDYADQRQPDDGHMLGDAGNGLWDGDKRLLRADWGTPENPQPDTLSPFDIDGDGLVELPIMTDAATIDINYEYSKAQVLRHTITHEIAHAIGVPSHSEHPLGLMFKYSSNWSRDEYISDWFRSMISVSNAKW